jgi:hypothetical protein
MIVSEIVARTIISPFAQRRRHQIERDTGCSGIAIRTCEHPSGTYKNPTPILVNRLLSRPQGRIKEVWA